MADLSALASGDGREGAHNGAKLLAADLFPLQEEARDLLDLVPACLQLPAHVLFLLLYNRLHLVVESFGREHVHVHDAQRRHACCDDLLGDGHGLADIAYAACAPAAEKDLFGTRSGHADGDLVQKRSEEHTSELQSRENLVCRLLLEKKKTRN